MGADGLSYVFDLEKSQPGIDSVVANLGKTEKALDVNDSKLKDLQRQLNTLRAPAEIDRLQKTISDWGKPKPLSNKGQIDQLQEKLSELRAPAELAKLKKEFDDFGKPKPTSSKDQISTLQQKLSDLKAPGEIKRLEKEIAGFGKPVTEGWQGVGHAIEDAKGKLHGFLEFSGALAAVEIVKGLTEKVFDFGKEAVKTALHAERLDDSLKLRFGVEGGEELDRWAGKFAHLTQLSKDQIKVVGAQLLGAGVDNEDLNRYTGAALDFAAKSQEDDKYGAAMQATSALSQAARFGKVSARTITNLGLSNDALRTLPEYAKLNDKQLREKLTGDSTITQEQLLRVMRGGGKLGEAGYAGGQDMGSKFKNVSGMWDDYLSKLTTSAGYDNLKGKLGELFETLNPESPKGQQIFAAMDSAFTGIIEQVGKIDFGAVANTITNDVIPATQELMGLIKPTLEMLTTTMRGLGLLAHSTHSITSMAGITDRSEGDSKLVQQAIVEPGMKAAGKFLYNIPFLGKRFKAIDDAAAARMKGPGETPPSDTSYDAIGGMSGGDSGTSYPEPRFSQQSAVDRSVKTGDIIVNVVGGAGDPVAQGQAAGSAAASSFKSEMVKANRQAGTEMGSG